MPRTVEIPDVGDVQFPDTMSDSQITDAIQNKILPDHRARVLKRSALVDEQKQLEAQPDPSTARLFLNEASQPFIPLPRAEVQPDDSKLTQFGKGVVNAGAGLVEAVESPMGVGLGAAATLAPWAFPVAGPIAARIMGAGFGGAAVKGGIEKGIEAYKEGSFEKAGEAVGDIGAGALMLRGAAGEMGKAEAAAPKVDAMEPSTAPAPEAAAAPMAEPAAPAPDALAPSTAETAPTTPTAPPAEAAPAPTPAPTTSPAPWTKATSSDSAALGTELYAGIPNPVTVAKAITKLAREDAGPYLKEAGQKAIEATKQAIDTTKEIAKDTLDAPKVDDYRRSVLDWSAKLQRSFSEASDAQETIRDNIISGPELAKEAAAKGMFEGKVKEAHLEGITNWIQADGDKAVLEARAAATKDPKLKAGYEAALSLTPKELALANQIKSTFAELAKRGADHDVLGDLKENYVPQVWDLGKGPATGSSRTLRENFRFSKASTFPTFFDGEQAGYTPRTKDISQLLPTYIHEMNSVIAARQLVGDLSKGVAEDGRPLVAPRGVAVPAEGGGATLVMPRALKGADTSDYRTMENQPALNKWRYGTTDEAGNPVMLKSDLALHPEIAPKLKAVLGRSAIKEWYEHRTGSIGDVPKVLMEAIDKGQGGTKKLMLGLLSTFHQVQEGTHALGHRINPFSNIPKIDLAKDASQFDAARHGLMLEPDRASASQFMEGLRAGGLLAKLPVIGPLSDWYSNYLFHDYIPGLKYKTYEASLERNKQVYAKELASGEITPEDVKVLTAQQMNAAYGHLNYADLGRNPTIQHIAQLALLAPDFLEARGRFAGQAIKGAMGFKSGREQALALATLAMGQAATAYTVAKLTGGEWDPRKPFEFHTDNRTYTMRSVPEDVSGLLKDARQFVYSRLSPLVGKGVVQGLSGVNWKGQKVTPAETAAELATAPMPLSLRAFLGVGNHSSVSQWEQLAGVLGLRISRYDPSTEMHDIVEKWKLNNSDPKIVAEAKQAATETHASSAYSDLRHALADNDLTTARTLYTKLLESHSHKQINEALNPNKPVSGSKHLEARFKESLTGHDLDLYNKIKDQQQRIHDRFVELQQHME